MIRNDIQKEKDFYLQMCLTLIFFMCVILCESFVKSYNQTLNQRHDFLLLLFNTADKNRSRQK